MSFYKSNLGMLPVTLTVLVGHMVGAAEDPGCERISPELAAMVDFTLKASVLMALTGAGVLVVDALIKSKFNLNNNLNANQRRAEGEDMEASSFESSGQFRGTR